MADDSSRAEGAGTHGTGADGSGTPAQVRRAGPEDADVVARLLHDFNTEFGSPTPEPAVLAQRLRRMLATQATRAWLVAERPSGPALGLALVTRRPNVWFEGPVDLLDELYMAPGHRSGGLGTALIRAVLDDARTGGVELVEVAVDAPDTDARRFYLRHGFQATDPDTGAPAFYLWQEL